MKRIILAGCLLAVLGILAGEIRLRLRRNGAAGMLARARLALQAGHTHEAGRLAQEYLRRHGEHPEACLIRGRVRTRLGKYVEARRALRRAVELQPGEASPVLALAQTHVLPALRRLDSVQAGGQATALRACVEDLQKANAVLAAAEMDDPVQALALRRMTGSNTIRLARAWRRIAEKRRDDAKTARAGEAAERAREIHRDSQQACQAARALERRAVAILCRVLGQAKSQLPAVTDRTRRELLIKQADTAARDAVQLCIDADDRTYWPQVREAISGLDQLCPVAFMLATMHEVRTRRFPSARARRGALARACREIDARLEQARQRPNDRAELLQARGELALALGDHQGAERICRQILKDTPSRPAVRLLLAETLMAAGRFAQADEILFVLKAELPRSPEVAFAYGRAAHAVGRLELAHEAMRTVTELDPRHAPARRYLVEKYLLEGYLDLAYTHAKEYHDRIGDAAALRLLVEAARNTRRHSQAADVLDEALRRYPDRPAILLAAAEGYALLGDNPRSVDAARRAARARPADTSARLAVARALIMVGRGRQAEAMLTRELTDSPDLAPVRFEAARLYALTGRHLQAIEHCRAAVEKDPFNTNYRLALAELLLKSGRSQECREALKPLPPDHPRAGLLRLRLRAVTGAPLDPAEILAQVGPNPPAALWAGWAFLRNGQPQRCLEVCLAGLERTPESVDLRLLAAQAYLKTAKTREAMQQLEAALAAAPSRLEVYLRLAEALARRHPVEAAAARLGSLPAARPELAQLALGRLLTERGQHARAAEVYRHLAGQDDLPPGLRGAARFALAKALAQTHSTRQALTELGALEKDPQWRRYARLARVNVLAGASRGDEARTMLAELRAEAHRRGDVEQLTQAAGLYQKLNRPDQALTCCDEILSMPGNAHRGSLLKAEIQRAAGRLAQAAGSYRRAIAALPSDLAARRALVEVLDARHQPLQALEALRDMEAVGGAGRAVALMTRAELFGKWGLHDQAAGCLAELGEIGYARNPQVLLALGRTLAKLGRRQQARRHLRNIPLHASQYLPARLALARLAPSAHEALGGLDKLGATHGDRPELLEEVMRALTEEGKPAQALTRFQAFVRDHCRQRPWPERPAFLALQAMIESARPRQAQALAQRLADQTGRARWRRLAALLTSQRPAADAPKALEALPPQNFAGLERALAAALIAKADRPKQRHQAAELLRANLALELGVPVLAYRIAADVLSADPGCQWAAMLAVRARGDPAALREVLSLLAAADTPARRAVQAALCQQQGQHARAARAFQLAADAADSAPELRLRQAVALEKAGRPAQALAVYRRVIAAASGPVAANAANNAACLVARLWAADEARLRQAYAWAGAAVRAAPEMSTYHDTRGWIAHLLGRRQEACLELRQALRGMKDSPEVHRHLAQAEAAAGHHRLARWHRQAAERLQGGEPRTARLPG